MTYFTYILFSEKIDKYYVGHTGEGILERLRKHNSKHKGFTGGKGDWKLKWNESFSSKEQAYRREKEIKKWKSRKAIEGLISSASMKV